MSAWLIYALLSAIMAACVAILGKIGLAHLDTHIATLVRSIIMALFLALVVMVQGKLNLISLFLHDKKGLFIIALSGIAGALSWLFYFMAIKAGNVAQVAAIDKLSVVFAVIFAVVLLGEKISFLSGIGVAMIAIGAILVAIGWFS